MASDRPKDIDLVKPRLRGFLNRRRPWAFRDEVYGRIKSFPACPEWAGGFSRADRRGQARS